MGRRAAGEMPRVVVHEASGNARVRFGGKTHWLGRCPQGVVTPEQLAKATRLWNEYLAAGEPAASVPVAEVVEVAVTPTAPPAAVACGITVAALALKYLDHAEVYYRTAEGRTTSSVDGIRMAARALFPFSDTAAVSFGPKSLKIVRESLVREGRPRVTCNRVVKTIRRMFKWAASEELVPAETWHALESVAALQKGRSTAPELPPVDEVPDQIVRATLPHLPRVVAAMVWFQRWTGARPGEVCLLRPCDIDRSGEVWVYTPEHHKLAWREDATPRRVAIGAEGQKVLMPFLLRAASSYCFSPREAETERLRDRRCQRQTPLYRSHLARLKDKHKGKAGGRRPGERYTTASYRRAITRAVEAANKLRESEGVDEMLPNWSPNQLRHLRAGEVEQALGIEAANAVLGHTNIRTTEIYARRKLQLAVEAQRQIG
ncbi:MAG: site-specific integrase [Planctomycetes bacterium]|nr:site-specific integrase [Planctomycetota bacterium]